MREPENILAVAKMRPDYMGFIFYNQSPRCVPEDFEFPVELDESVKRIGVFVNEDVGQVLETVNRYGLHGVQLHGDETVSDCEKIKREDIIVIKTFSIDDQFNFSATTSYEPVVDFFLFDTKGKQRGGNARVFDWNLLQRYNQKVPFFLSGGLSPENISKVAPLREMNLFGLDINSGVETSPGLKDVEKIGSIVKNLKSKI